MTPEERQAKIDRIKKIERIKALESQQSSGEQQEFPEGTPQNPTVLTKPTLDFNPQTMIPAHPSGWKPTASDIQLPRNTALGILQEGKPYERLAKAVKNVPVVGEYLSPALEAAAIAPDALLASPNLISRSAGLATEGVQEGNPLKVGSAGLEAMIGVGGMVNPALSYFTAGTDIAKKISPEGTALAEAALRPTYNISKSILDQLGMPMTGESKDIANAVDFLAQGKILEGGKELGREVIKTVKEYPAVREANKQASIEKDIKEAVKPKAKELNREEVWNRAKGYLADQERKSPLNRESDESYMRQARDKTEDAMHELWTKKVSKYDERHPDARLDRNEIAQQVRQEASKSRHAEIMKPEEIQATVEIANKYLPEQMNLKDANSVIAGLNSELSGFYKKNSSEQQTVLNKYGNLANLKALRDAIAEKYFDKLDLYKETGSKEVRKDWGALSQMRDAFERNIISSEGQTVSTFGKANFPVGSALAVVGEVALAHASPQAALYVGLGGLARKVLLERGKQNPTVARAFKKLGKSSASAPNYGTPDFIPKGILPQETKTQPEIFNPVETFTGSKYDLGKQVGDLLKKKGFPAQERNLFSSKAASGQRLTPQEIAYLNIHSPETVQLFANEGLTAAGQLPQFSQTGITQSRQKIDLTPNATTYSTINPNRPHQPSEPSQVGVAPFEMPAPREFESGQKQLMSPDISQALASQRKSNVEQNPMGNLFPEGLTVDGMADRIASRPLDMSMSPEEVKFATENKDAILKSLNERYPDAFEKAHEVAQTPPITENPTVNPSEQQVVQPTTEATPQTLVEGSGLIYKGIQQGAGGKSYIMADDPTIKNANGSLNTLMIPQESMTPEGIRAYVEASRAKLAQPEVPLARPKRSKKK